MKYGLLFVFLALATICNASPIEENQHLIEFNENDLEKIETNSAEIENSLKRQKRTPCAQCPSSDEHEDLIGHPKGKPAQGKAKSSSSRKGTKKGESTPKRKRHD